MAKKERVEKTKSQARREELQKDAAPTVSKAELKKELDDVLDEIDSVLEENAEDFVKGYVQKGGQ